MRRTRFLPLLVLAPLLALLTAVLFIVCPAKKREPARASQTAASRKPDHSERAAATKQRRLPFSTIGILPRKAAVIIDDLGYSLEVIRSACSLQKPITVAVLPFVPLTRAVAQSAHECGLEIMLHLPLESLLPKPENAPEGMISAGMTREEIRRDVLSCLEQVPWCKGVNNHAGSKITEDTEMMPEILEVLKEKRLYFIDSRTHKDSVAFETARRMGVPAASRRIFLDGDLNESAIKAKIEELFQWARDKGRAVGICHPKKETLAALEKYLGLADRYGVKLVFASAIVE